MGESGLPAVVAALEIGSERVLPRTYILSRATNGPSIAQCYAETNYAAGTTAGLSGSVAASAHLSSIRQPRAVL